MQARILIAIPNLGAVHPLLVMKLVKWFTAKINGVEQLSLFMPSNNIPHDSARNFCVQHFLKTDMTHLFFIDSDVVPPDDALEKLVAADKQFITGLYPSMRMDNNKNQAVKVYNAFVYGDDGQGGYGLIPIMDGEGGVVPIDRAGGGCLLISREVIEKVGEPWFKFQYHSSGIMYYGEDIDFCKKAQDAGFQLFAHLDVKCNHFKNIML